MITKYIFLGMIVHIFNVSTFHVYHKQIYIPFTN